MTNSTLTRPPACEDRELGEDVAQRADCAPPQEPTNSGNWSLRDLLHEQVDAVDSVHVIHRKRVQKRLDLLGGLPNGWAGEDEGVAPSELLRSQVAAFVTGLALPYLFASPEGGISCEWDGLNGAQASACFFPDGRIEVYRSRGMDDQRSCTFEAASASVMALPVLQTYLLDISR